LHLLARMLNLILFLIAICLLAFIAFVYFSFRLDEEASKLMGPLKAGSRERLKL